jgi:hypothetical protein
MALWAGILEACAEFPAVAIALYHSAVNYTTLGDIVMSGRWRFLGPLEATDGMLMFGISTAMIFAVIQELCRGAFQIFETDVRRVVNHWRCHMNDGAG